MESLEARKRATELEFELAAAHFRHDQAKRLRQELDEIERQIENLVTATSQPSLRTGAR
jgi:uncharacterized protein YhaN